MILVFGGTTEGRKTIRVLDESGSPYFYSTLSGWQKVRCLHGTEISGALDAGSMSDFCRKNGIRLIVDAAHPFACRLHDAIARTSLRENIPVIRYERKFPPRDPGITWCEDYEDAIRQLEKSGIRSLLALTGVQTISRLRNFWEKNTCYFRVLDREDSVQKALAQGFPSEQLVFFPTHTAREENTSGSAGYLAGFPPADFTDMPLNETILQMETDLMKRLRPEAVLTKESGESGYFPEKVAAARALGIPVFAVKRPPLPAFFETVSGEAGLRKKIEKILPDFFPLHCGFTTGTCATAAAKAALLALLSGNELFSVEIRLPSGEDITLPVARTEFHYADRNPDANGSKSPADRPDMQQPDGSGEKARPGIAAVSCTVIKDAGDDPDITDGSAITSTVRLNDSTEIRFIRGEGVGIVTLPGLGIPIGEPAINPTPRKMIAEEFRRITPCGADVTISVAGGRELARKTFNPKLGITDGISIIGTSGIVRPFSSEAFTASIRKEIQVAKALGNEMIVINSGAKSEQYVKKEFPQLPPQAFIHYGNFIGETISAASEEGMKKVAMGIMIGKAVKLACGHLDTHSKKTAMDKEFLQSVSRQAGCSPRTGETISGITMAKELWTLLPKEEQDKFFPFLLKLCYRRCAPLLPQGTIEILLITEDGEIPYRQGPE